jgi:methyl-accepting chemotaxis protein
MEMSSVLAEIAINMRNILLDSNVEKKKEYVKRITDYREKYDGAFKKLEELTAKDDKKSHDLIAAIKETQAISRGLNSRVIDLSITARDAEAIELLNKEARPPLRKWMTQVSDLRNHNIERNKIRYDESVKYYDSASFVDYWAYPFSLPLLLQYSD